MSRITFSPKWFKENEKKIKEAYNISLANKYDINSVKDIIEILKAIDPTNATEAYAKEFSKVLQLFEHALEKKLHKKSEKTLPN